MTKVERYSKIDGKRSFNVCVVQIYGTSVGVQSVK